MKPYYERDGVQIFCGDCREVLPSLGPFSACVTDPPYGLSFMGKAWDHGVPGVEFWQVIGSTLHPGAHVLAFGGTRTFHRLTCAIEDAGFEVRDCLSWLYGQGFPKSLDISKAFDKSAGAEREIVGPSEYARRRSPGRAMQPQGAGERPGNHDLRLLTEATTESARRWQGWGTALKPGWEPIVVARKPCKGTVVANVERYGTGGINVDGCRIEAAPWHRGRGTVAWSAGGIYAQDEWTRTHMSAGKNTDGHALGRWPANVVLDEDAAAMLDEQSKRQMHSAGSKRENWCPTGHSTWFTTQGGDGAFNGHRFGDDGGASRFFYVAKASRRERGEHNDHPTVKPIKLMEWLCRLVTPPDGVVVDPFLGSGTTAIACARLGIPFVGVELVEHHAEIAAKRLEQEVLPLEAAM